jgi:uncharacterized YigZ family protein
VSAGSDARRVPAGEGRGDVREKASRFLAFARRVGSPSEAGEFVEGLRREHHDATHVAFAFRIGAGDAAVVRSSDAGEPSGTAGRPILAAIESAGMTDAAVAVVRWFGGTKLGTGGLARAYRLAAERALAAAGGEIVYETVAIEVRCAHARTGAVRRLLDPPAVRLASERFEPEPVFVLEVRRSRAERLERTLTEARLDFRWL